MTTTATRGALLALLATILIWAYSWIVMKQVLQHAGPFNFSALRYSLGALGLIVVALCVPQRPFEWTWDLIAGLAYSVILASSVAWGLWLIVLHRLPTAVASVASLGVPIVSVLLAWAILHEQPSGMEMIGIAFILLGLLAVSGIRLRRSQAARG